MDQPASQRAESTSLAPYVEHNDSAGPDGSYFKLMVSFCAFDSLQKM